MEKSEQVEFEKQIRSFFDVIAEAICDNSENGAIQVDVVLNALSSVALDVILHCPIEEQLQLIESWSDASVKMQDVYWAQFDGAKN